MRILNPGEVDLIPRESLPRHVALIIDGNRRWAFGRGIPADRAHDGASAAIGRAVVEAHRLRIPYLTFYCMSTENLGRSDKELQELLSLDRWLWPTRLIEVLVSVKAEIDVIGDISDTKYRREVFEPIFSVNRTKIPEISVSFAVNYGGRRELERAAARPGGIAANLYNQHPDVDLLIRTSGEQRISNFMIWQCAYAEFVFMDTLWPDFTAVHLDSALAEYASRQRRMGH